MRYATKNAPVRLRLLLILAGANGAAAAPTIELEIVTESGLQITAPQQWLQLLTQLGIENVQIRGQRPGDAPAVVNRGSAERPQYHVVGVLTSRERLQLPGESFTRSDSNRLKDYFARLSADGNERLTAPQGLFGLTEQEMKAVLADLSQPVDFETKGQRPNDVVDRLQAKFKQRVVIDPAADSVLRQAAESPDELKGLSAGTALAMQLRNFGLAFRPEKIRGQPVVYRVAAGGSSAVRPTGGPPVATEDDHAGKISDIHQKNWPVGWQPETAPGATAPSMFNRINAEIDGYTLAESIDAIGPRLKLPYFVDHSYLAAAGIRPAEIKIKVEHSQISYMRLLERVLAQRGSAVSFAPTKRVRCFCGYHVSRPRVGARQSRVRLISDRLFPPLRPPIAIRGAGVKIGFHPRAISRAKSAPTLLWGRRIASVKTGGRL